MKSVIDRDMRRGGEMKRHPLVMSEETARAIEAEGVSTAGCLVVPAPSPAPAEVLAIEIRPATGDDVPWIYSSWLKSYREHGKGAHLIPRETYYKHHRQRMEKITSTSGVVTIVACPAENSEQILGWLCGAKLPPYDAVLYYGHVKSHARRQGIMKAMCAAFGVGRGSQVAYTHHTRISWVERDPASGEDKFKSTQLSDLLPLNWHYNPYLFI